MTEQPQLTLYNSLTRKKEVFTPQDPKRVTMYNCGPTVYSYAHIGNARAAVVADVLFRVLRHIYGEDHVVYARNITDVDDKIIASAKDQGVPISDITEKYARIYNEDLAALGCLPPTHQPKATEAIDEMQDIIVELLNRDIAYISGNDVLFDVTKKDDYGKLSGRELDDNLAGARVEVAGSKKNPADFLLWKYVEGEDDKFSYEAPKIQAFADEHWRKFFNEPKQLSPGRPGWHIECSAMIREVLGNTIDIHCGGIDLKFPHHENEIAQSECANDKPLAKFWVHNEFLNMGSEKMSKSLGNVKLVHDLLKKWDGEVIRLALLKAHYRSELTWSDDLLKESKANLDKWYRLCAQMKDYIPSLEWVQIKETAHAQRPLLIHLWDDLDVSRFLASFFNKDRIHSEYVDDPNLQQAYSHELEPGMDWVKGVVNSGNAFVFLWNFIGNLNLLGLLQKDPEEWFRGGLDYDGLVAEYDDVRAQAIKAKKAGDKAKMGELFKRSDEIRDQFKAEGVIIESGAGGKSTWRKA